MLKSKGSTMCMACYGKDEQIPPAQPGLREFYKNDFIPSQKMTATGRKEIGIILLCVRNQKYIQFNEGLKAREAGKCL